MDNVKFLGGGVDEYGKYIIAEYNNSQQEKIYFTGSKADKNRVENLEEKYPNLFA